MTEKARADSVDFVQDTLVVNLRDGRTLMVPLEWFPRLRDARPESLGKWRLIGRGIGIHWEELDEDLSVEGLLKQPVPSRELAAS